MDDKKDYSVDLVLGKTDNLSHVNLVIHSVVKMSTKISKRFTNVNSRNNLMINYKFRKVLRRGSRRLFYSKCRAFIHPDFHISQSTPSSEMVKQDLIFVTKASYNSCVVRKLKPVHRIGRVNCETKLLEFPVGVAM